MELNIRRLKDSDWETLVSWWNDWPDWVNPPKDFLPENGTGGLMVEKNNKPIVAGFLYFTNSTAVLLEWVVSDPDYKEKDKKKAVELLILSAENVCIQSGKKYMFSIGRNNSLINTHKKMGWNVDNKPSYEISKKLI
tara:strand:- start:2292 stop:2702 length:411 start_codon:yes stop_codon:yes gene_type:complete